MISNESVFSEIFPGINPNSTTKIACPYCNETKLSINRGKDGTFPFQCFGCGKTGNIYTLQKDFLPGAVGYDRHEFSELEKKRWAYHKVTGKTWRLSDWTCATFRLDVVDIPTKDLSKTFRAIAMLDGHGKVRKYLRTSRNKSGWFSPPREVGSRDFWHNAESIDPKSDELYVFAGEWDLFAASEKAGLFRKAVSPLYGESLGKDSPRYSPEVFGIFKNRHVTICFDNDAAGRTGARNLAAAAKRFGAGALSIKLVDLSIVIPEKGGDLDDFFRSGKTAADFFQLVHSTQPTEISQEGLFAIIPEHKVPLPKYDSAYPPDVCELLWRASRFPRNVRMNYVHDIAAQYSSIGLDGDVKEAAATLTGYNAEMEAQQGAALREIISKHLSSENIKTQAPIIPAAPATAYYYTRGVYKILNEDKTKQIVDAITSMIYPADSAKRYAEHLRTVRTYIDFQIASMQSVEFDKDTSKVNFANGLYDVRTGQLLPHTPDNLSTLQIPMAYIQPADEAYRPPENFHRALKDWFPSERNRETFLAMLYYIISGDRSRQLAFFWYGGGQDGKGEAARLLRSILGDCYTAVPMESLQKDFLLAQLQGKYVNVADEMDSRARVSDAAFKRLTGGSQVTVDVKYGQPITFENRAQFVILSNHLPSSSDLSRGLQRRLKLLEFQQISDEKRIPNFFDMKLKGEVSGILHYLMTEGRRLLEAGALDRDDTDRDMGVAITKRNAVAAFWHEWFEDNSEDVDHASEIIYQIPSGPNRDRYMIDKGQAYEKYKKHADESGHKWGSVSTFATDSVMVLDDLLKRHGLRLPGQSEKSAASINHDEIRFRQTSLAIGSVVRRGWLLNVEIPIPPAPEPKRDMGLSFEEFDRQVWG